MKHSLSRSRAFTLIELLVVIAIIAILAAILFPVFAQAKQAAKKTVDLSNMKEIELGSIMYTSDYDDINATIRNDSDMWVGGGTMASSAFGPDTFQTHDLVEQVAPYIKNHGIWASPEDTLTHDTCTGGKTYTTYAKTGGPIDFIPTYNGQANVIQPPQQIPNWTPADTPESYGVFGMPWHYNCQGNYGYLPCTGSLSTTQVSSPGNTITFAPMFITWSIYTGIIQQRTDQREFAFKEFIPDFPGVASCPYCWCLPSDALSMEDFNGTANWAFADGHAKSMPRTSTMDRTWYTDPATAISSFKKNLFDAVNPGYN